ncbi:uncharacterized protein LOC127711053 isoform X1 [Mytilus californianus]|uniref:uncharacterized protein LOC127711053 isoform X1 n=1 Tax=Mytilus californianus TaxID=6549 RepID=UPI00224717BF|nr:uncharacterized protein LOC127711053 isoform X1 [Mytilus californianus]
MGELSVMLTLSLLYGNIIDPKTGKDQTGHHWSYFGDSGPSHWSDHYPRCNGQRQSPVDIRTGDVEFASWLTELQFYGYDKNLGQGEPCTIKNNGHTASMAITHSLKLRGAHLNGDYQLAEMHLHWGFNNSRGSEHALNGKKYPAEIHFVHYSTRYGNLSEAMKMPDGLAVIGVFVELVPEDTYAFERLANGIDSILEYGKKANVSNVRMLDFLPQRKNAFYHYRGSLTTPPCYESVMWFVMADTIPMSERQLDRFRHLQEKVHEHVAATGKAHSVSSRVFKSDPVYIRENCRPLQPLNGRKVYSNIMSLQRPQLRDFELPSVKVSPIRHNYLPQGSNRMSSNNHANSGTDYIFRGLSPSSNNHQRQSSFNGVISNGNSLLIGNIKSNNINGALYQHLRPDQQYPRQSGPVNKINTGHAFSNGNSERMHVFKTPDTASVLSDRRNAGKSGKSGPLLDYIFTQMNGLTKPNTQNQRHYHANDHPGIAQPKDRIFAGLSDFLANPVQSRVLSNPVVNNNYIQSSSNGNFNNNNPNNFNQQKLISNKYGNHLQKHIGQTYNNHHNVHPSLASYPIPRSQNYQRPGNYVPAKMYPDYHQSRSGNSLTVFGYGLS